MPQPRKIPIEKLTLLITKATEGNQGMMLTDRQLVHTMNRSMKRADRISYRTFQRYKTAAMAYGEVEVDGTGKWDDTYADLYDALMDNDIAQKLALCEKMLTADAKQSRDYKWIMERKFPDLNLRLQTQKEMATYQMTELRMQQEELKQQKMEMVAHSERESKLAWEQKILANMNAQQPTAPSPTPTPTLDTPVAVPTQKNTVSSQPGTPNYSDLWVRPNGTRRSKEEFLIAVKERKALG